MKNCSAIFLLLTPIFSYAGAKSNLVVPKGCQFHFSYQVTSDSLIMYSGFSGECTESNQAAMQAYFGNGDQQSWLATESSGAVVYTYPHGGDYQVDVWKDNSFYFEFTASVSDPIHCDTLFPCSPAFDAELFYSQQNHEYSIQAIRNFSCTYGTWYWQIGAAIISKDTLRWFFGNIEDGSLIDICLHIKVTCVNSVLSDSSSCQQFILSQDYATLIDPIPDSSVAFSAFPNPAIDVLHVKVQNFKAPFALRIISIDGREFLNERIIPSSPLLDFDIAVNDFPSGVYFIDAEAENQIPSQIKFLKE